MLQTCRYNFYLNWTWTFHSNPNISLVAFWRKSGALSEIELPPIILIRLFLPLQFQVKQWLQSCDRRCFCVFWSGCNFTDELKCLLLLCVLIGHVEVVKLLVSRSADKSCKDKQGYTPLHAAAASGHIEIVKYLLRMGAEVSLPHCDG